MSYQIFISHDNRDVELARDLARRFKEAGARVAVLGDEVSGGAPIRSINRALSEADEVIILLTDNSANDSNVIYDLGVADSLNKRVTPVIVNEGVEQRAPLIGRHFIRYGELPKYISALKRRVKAA